MSAQTDTLFWFAAPYVSTGHCGGATCPGGQPILFRISTLGIAATVTISEPANPAFVPIVLNIPANSTVSQDVTAQRAMIENVPANSINNFGLQVRSDNLVTVYYEVNQWYNPEIFALKGKNSLGTEFYISSQNVWNNGVYAPTPYSSFEIVATEDNTSVTITPSKNITGHTAGVPFTIILNKGQTYSATATSQSAANHLTGSHVVTDKPVAITISDDSVAKDGCRDLIGDQTIPVNIIGKEYIIMKGQVFTDERFFVLAVQDNTDITVNGVYVTTINTGQTYSAAFTVNTHVGASNPVYMYHVSGFQCELGSAILPPIDQCTGSTQVGFTRSIGQDFYLNIMVRAGAEDGFILNGDGPNTIIPASAFAAIPGSTQWLAAQINLTAGATVPVGAASILINIKDLFHMGIINGNSSVGCRYGYFSDFNVLQIGAIVAGTGSDVIKRCYGEPAQLIATGGTNYTWSPQQDLDNPNIQNPVATPLVTTKYTVTVSGACNMTDSASVTVYVAPPMNAGFSVEHTNGCTPFTANIVNASMGVTDYNWIFGDGDSSVFSGTVFDHTYENFTATPDTFTLQLFTTNIYDCRDTAERTVVVYPQVQADFTYTPASGCHPLTVTYTNNSVAAGIFEWTYGDGGSSGQADTTHTFYNYNDNDTVYTTILIASSQFNCKDTVQKNITVAPYLKADFAVEYTTGCTPFSCIINNASIGADTYEWDFGDGFTSTSSAAVIDHTYINITSDPVTFQIELVAKNPHNCSDTIRRTITVYPAVNAVFTSVPSEGCNELTVAFTNNSIAAVTYDWLFGDGGSSVQTNPSHVFANPQVYDTTYITNLIAVSQYGCRDTTAAPVTVYSFLKADFTIDYISGCSPFNSTVINSSVGATAYSWDFGDGNQSVSDSSSIFHTFVNSTSFPVVYNIGLIVANSHNCSDTIVKPVTVFPPVNAAFSMTPGSGCNPLTVGYTNNSTGAVSYEWLFGDGGSSSSADTSHEYVNSGNSDTVFISRLVAVSQYGCTDTTSLPLTVYPVLKADFSVSYPAGCTPFNCNINNTSTGALTYEWDMGDGTILNAGNNQLSYQYINNTASALAYMIRLTVTNQHGCRDSMEIPVTVYPAANSSFTANPLSGCNPLTVNFNNNSTGAVNFIWFFGDGGSSTSTDETHIFENPGPADTVFTTLLIAVSTDGCNDTSTEVISVNPDLKADFTIQYATACSPYHAVINNISTGAETYDWDFGNGSASMSPGPVFNEVYDNLTTLPVSYDIRLIAANNSGCSDTIHKIITVNPSVFAGIASSDTSGCSPLQVGFTNLSNGAAYFEWIFADGTTANDTNPSHIFNNSGSADTIYHVNLISSSAWFCTDTASVSITVHPVAGANFYFEENFGCSPFNLVIHNTSQGAVNYYWDFGNGDTSASNANTINQVYTNTADTQLTFLITLRVENSNGCNDSLAKPVTVSPPVNASFMADVLTGCNPVTVAFTNQSTGAVSSQWIYGDGGTSNLQEQIHVFTNNNMNDTTYQVVLIATSGYSCTDTAEGTITVFPYVKADFTTDYISGCTPFQIDFTNTSAGAGSYHWDFGDGTVSDSATQVINHTYINNTNLQDTFLVSLHVENSNGCRDSITRTILVSPAVTSSFYASPVTGCNPLTVAFQNNSTGASLYEWTYGDGGSSFLFDSTHVFTNLSVSDTTYEVSLISVSLHGCSDTSIVPVTVYSKLEADFSFEYSSGCTPFNVQVQNTATGASSYNWDFGDGTTDTSSGPSIFHSYSNQSAIPLAYSIRLIVENPHQCYDTLQRDIVVFPPVVADFTASPVSGCNPLTVDFSNLSLHATDINWEYGDGGSSGILNPVHTFSNTSTEDTVFSTLMIAVSQYNCRDTALMDITVFSNINADFTLEYHSGCSPFVAGFTNHSTGAVSYYWDFGNGNTSDTSATAFNYTYQNPSVVPDTNTVTLIVDNNHACFDTITRDVIVFPPVNASFTVSPDSGCSPLNAIFSNTTTGAVSYQWDFGDNNTSSLFQPGHTYFNNNTGDVNYSPVLTAFSEYNCSDTAIGDVFVSGTIHVDFTIDNDNGCSPFILNLHNESYGATSCLWDFGDGSTSSVSDTLISHSFINNTTGPVSFTIFFRGTNNTGCSDSIARQVTVFPGPSAAFSCEPSQGCSPLVAAFTNQSSQSAGMTWDFGDGYSSGAINPTHLFTNNHSYDTTYSVSLIVTSEYLCRDTAYSSITVSALPEVVFTAEATEGCSPVTTTIHNYSTGGALFNWGFGDGTFSTSPDTLLQHQYVNITDNYIAYELTLSLTNDAGCTSAMSKTILVYPEIISSFLADTGGCSPFFASFMNTSEGAIAYNWAFGDGTISDTIHPTHLFTNNTTNIINRSIMLVSYSQSGCTDTSSATVTIYPSPDAQFNIFPATQTYPSATVTIMNATSGTWNWFWDFGDGDSTSVPSPSQHTYETWGTYIISLKVWSNYCADTMMRVARILSTPPVSNFTPSVTEGCMPLAVSFTNHSLYGNQFSWTFGDGGTSTQENPVYTFYNSGTYDVRLTVSGFSGQSVKIHTVTVYQAPHAFFHVEPDVITIPDEYIICYDQSDLASEYLWDFGDGQASSEANPTHTYTKEGEYDISLTVWSSHHCSDTFTIPKAVRARTECQVLFPNAFTPSPGGPGNGYYSLPDHSFDVFHPLFRGVDGYQLEIFNRWGELLFISKDINIGWDGYYHGELCKQDVYVWKAKWKCYDGTDHSKAGDVTLLR